jgi:NodT family efflux transporter outer membrane factor (OMF) lipoprotein
MKKHYLSALILLSLACCEVGPDYVRPSADTPTAFKEAGDWQQATPRDDIDRGAWWAVYHDETLDGLEKQIEISNQNLKAAEAAYRLALATSDQTRAGLFPTVTAGPSVIRSGTGQPHVPAQTTYDLSASGSWTLDVWGKIRRAVEGSEASAEASAADLASARLSAQAQLATDYFDLRSQDELERILISTVDDDKKILTITQNMYKAGVSAEADILSAQTQLESAEAAAVNVGVKRAQLEHAIAILIGKPPGDFALYVEKNVGRVPNIPAEVPSTLLERRPDIAAAERTVAAANAQIGVAEGAWYPDLTLSASYGTSALSLGKLLQASSTLWSFGPTLAETIFDGGAREAALAQAEAGYDQQVANYRQTVLTAFGQVEDNLAALRILDQQAKIEDSVVTDAHKATQLTLNQYKEGTVPYSSVLTAQITELTNKQTALTVLDNRLDASVALIDALGGGWDSANWKQ